MLTESTVYDYKVQTTSLWSMSKLWLMYDKKDRMVQRVTKNIRHRIKYLTQTSFLAHENKIKSYSSCLCAFMGLIPVVTALSHNSNCVFTYYITFISVTIIIITHFIKCQLFTKVATVWTRTQTLISCQKKKKNWCYRLFNSHSCNKHY